MCVRACKPERAGFACVCLCVCQSQREREKALFACHSVYVWECVLMHACGPGKGTNVCMCVCAHVCFYACAYPYVCVSFFVVWAFVHAHC